MSRRFIPIWFFIGSLLLVYGILILGAGIYQKIVPPAQPTVLAELHAGIRSSLGGPGGFPQARSPPR